MPFFESYPPNAEGTDYVVGDLHGHQAQLFDELGRVGFDISKDRLFCTGDLVDRGPDSFGTLKLILEPWFYFVRGNHEDDLPNFLEYLHLIPDGEVAARETGQDWVYRLSKQDLDFLKTILLQRIEAAPMVLRVEGEQGFWVVHADRGEFGKYSDPLTLLDDERLPNATDDNQLEALMWSRRLIKQIPLADLSDHGIFRTASGQEFAPGIGLTFVGHSYVERPILYRSHLFIDTGAGTTPNGKLTVLRVSDVIKKFVIHSPLSASTHE